MTAELGALALAVAVLFGALALASLRHGSLIRDGLVKASTYQIKGVVNSSSPAVSDRSNSTFTLSAFS